MGMHSCKIGAYRVAWGARKGGSGSGVATLAPTSLHLGAISGTTAPGTCLGDRFVMLI
jgi:hypothetical protein